LFIIYGIRELVALVSLVTFLLGKQKKSKTIMGSNWQTGRVTDSWIRGVTLRFCAWQAKKVNIRYETAKLPVMQKKTIHLVTNAFLVME